VDHNESTADVNENESNSIESSQFCNDDAKEATDDERTIEEKDDVMSVVDESKHHEHVEDSGSKNERDATSYNIQDDVLKRLLKQHLMMSSINVNQLKEVIMKRRIMGCHLQNQWTLRLPDYSVVQMDGDAVFMKSVKTLLK
jgi:hypothetical protein